MRRPLLFILPLLAVFVVAGSIEAHTVVRFIMEGFNNQVSISELKERGEDLEMSLYYECTEGNIIVAGDASVRHVDPRELCEEARMVLVAKGAISN